MTTGAWGLPNIEGEVEKRTVDPRLLPTPTYDEDAEINVRSVAPYSVPVLSDQDPDVHAVRRTNIKASEMQEPTFDNDAGIIFTRRR